MEAAFSWCKDLWTPKTFNRFSFVANVGWITIGIILLGVFLDMEINESRFDFGCDVNTAEIDKDFIGQKCFVQYDKRYNKPFIPLYGFVIVNFLLPVGVCVIYSLFVKSRIYELEARGNAQNPTQRKLFTAYCCQLATRFCLAILFIVLLQTQVSYPRNFPSDFKCDLLRGDSHTANATGNKQAQSYKCQNDRAHKKTSWVYAVSGANGILALVLLTEIFIIFSRARKGIKFIEDSQFFADHLKSNSELGNERIPLLAQQLSAFIKSIKNSVLKRTEQLIDLDSPLQPKPGEGVKPKELKLDQIYTNLVIHADRAYYDFTGDRRKQLQSYPKPEANLLPKRPQDIIDAEHKNILVVGRPGIGKTLFCTKLLRDWASDSMFDQAQNAQMHFDVAFLLKFRRFNSAADLSLRELLARSEFSTPLNDVVWDYILENPSKVLVIFDGVDEFSAKKKIANDDSDYSNTAEEKMPLHALYNKIASGKLLDGATVLTTTRPTAVSCVKHLKFDRTVEILGFTSEQVEDYVGKFKEDDKGAGETIWQHISSNLNLLSLCYIPVNSFIICSCLLHILRKYTSNSAGLPTKLTHIYSFATKLFYFRHNDRYRFQTDSQDMSYELFDNLPDRVKDDFKKLGHISFKGIKEGRLIFGSDEVTNLEDCGLLHRLPDLEAPAQRPFEKPKAQFCFTHLTIQEFLAAKHVTDTRNDAELREFVSDHIKKGAWQVVIQFVAGLLSDREEPLIDIFIDLLPDSRRQRRSQRGSITERCTLENAWPDDVHECHLALTLCHCLYEIDAKDSAIQNKIREIGFDTVDFSDCNLTPIDCTAIINLVKIHKEISCIDLGSNDIRSLGCKELQKLFSCSNDNESKLTSLNLSFNNITSEGIKHLVEVIKHRNCKLSYLDLSHNNITSEGLEHLVEVLTEHRNCNLSNLNLSDNNLTSEGIKHLAEVLKHSHCKLEYLSLSLNNITNEDVEHLVKALKDSNYLRDLSLSENGITDQSIKNLVEALKHSNCKLGSLNLADNKITDESINYLVEALKHNNCKLISLNLADNNLTNKCIDYLVDALKHNNCKLISLILTCNNITDESIENLVEAVNHSNCKLRSLSLIENKITSKGKIRLTEAISKSGFKLQI